MLIRPIIFGNTTQKPAQVNSAEPKPAASEPKPESRLLTPPKPEPPTKPLPAGVRPRDEDESNSH